MQHKLRELCNASEITTDFPEERVMEIPRSVPTDALFLEMGIWPIRFETEFRQLTYLKRIIDRDQNDPVYQLYQEMLK